MRQPGFDDWWLRDLVLSPVVAFNFAVSQPVLELLGDNVDFFVAHGTRRAGLLLFTALLTLGIPLVLSLAIRIAAAVHLLAARALHGLLFVVLAGLLGFQVIETVTDHLVLQTVAAAVFAVTALLLFSYIPIFRTFLRLGAAAPLIFGLWFLVGTPAAQILLAEEVSLADVSPAARPHVFVVVFDELPTSSIMHRNGRVDEERFPAFGRLQREGTWYRNATAVHAQTRYSIPAILTGRYPDETKVALYSDYPHSLFTMLGRTYDVTSYEPVTGLCPPRTCTGPSSDSARSHSTFADILKDAATVYLHRLLPEEMRNGLPPIHDRWARFGAGDNARPTQDAMQRRAVDSLRGDREGRFRDFTRQIEARQRPSLHFIHAMLPHSPWLYLPSGQRYELEERAVPGRGRNKWADDDWLTTQAYQRHILQAGFADNLLASLIDRLVETGIYRDSLLIVTADHGITFEPGVPPREVREEHTLPDIAAVPLFVKAPQQEQGSVRKHPVETIDILPTIADILGIDHPWTMDGRPLGENGGAERHRQFMNPSEPIPIGPEAGDPLTTLERTVAKFPGGGTDAVFRIGTYGSLIGDSAKDHRLGARPTMKVKLDGADAYQDVDVSGDFLPVHLWGRLQGEAEEPLHLAVAVNGAIAATSRSYLDDEGMGFTAMLRPSSFVQGPNEIDVYIIRDQGDGIMLEPTVDRSAE